MGIDAQRRKEKVSLPFSAAYHLRFLFMSWALHILHLLFRRLSALSFSDKLFSQLIRIKFHWNAARLLLKIIIIFRRKRRKKTSCSWYKLQNFNFFLHSWNWDCKSRRDLNGTWTTSLTSLHLHIAPVFKSLSTALRSSPLHSRRIVCVEWEIFKDAPHRQWHKARKGTRFSSYLRSSSVRHVMNFK